MYVLCGTDFSEPSIRMATVAAHLAARLGDSLRLVHALEAGGGSEAAEADAQANLEAEARRLHGLGVDVETELVRGAAARALPSLAARPEVRLVVVASTSERTRSRFLLGSVAESLAQRSPTPTLVLRDDAPFSAWDHKERALKVLLAWDHSESSAHAARWLDVLDSLGPCEVTALHIAWPAAERERLAVRGPIDLERLDPEVEQSLHTEMERSLSQLRVGPHARLEVRGNLGRPDVPFVDAAEQEQADLVVLGAHQRRGAARLWYPSFSRRVLESTSASVLLVPLRAPAPARAAVPVHPVESVLAGVDLSPRAEEAAGFAYGLVTEGGTVHLAHFIEHAGGGEEEEAAVRDRLEQLIPQSGVRDDVSTVLHVLRARDAGEGLRALAERLAVDAICVASRGPQGVSAAVLGSVARHLLARSHRPILVVPEQER